MNKKRRPKITVGLYETHSAWETVRPPWYQAAAVFIIIWSTILRGYNIILLIHNRWKCMATNWSKDITIKSIKRKWNDKGVKCIFFLTEPLKKLKIKNNLVFFSLKQNVNIQNIQKQLKYMQKINLVERKYNILSLFIFHIFV